MPRRTISKAAREAGVSVETVRFYERMGILAKPDDSSEGWRQYPETTVWTIHYIKDAQKMSFSLSDCKTILEQSKHAVPPHFCKSVRQMAEKKLDAVNEEIQKLRAVRKSIKTFLTKCKARERTGACPIFERIRVTYASGPPDRV